MSTCKDCFHYEACSGFTPTDLDQDVFDYCRKGIADEIPDIEERCSCFTDKADVVEVVRCKDCKHCEQSYLYKEKGKESNLEYICCAFGNVSPDFYCGIGERSENE